MVYNQSNGNNFRSTLSSSFTTLGDVQFYIYIIISCMVISYIVFYILRKKEYDWIYGPKIDTIAKWLPGIQQKKIVNSTNTNTPTGTTT